MADQLDAAERAHYHDMLTRVEPNLSSLYDDGSKTSVAVSLKRIADHLASIDEHLMRLLAVVERRL